MDKLVASRITGGNSDYGRVKSDFYPTPSEVTQALLDFIKLPDGTTIWEPACGEGHMVNVFLQNGLNCIGTDILTGTDFLTEEQLDSDWIITNPPFSLSEQFITRCVQYNKPFALLLKIQYWNAKKRHELFVSHTPMYILPLTWRPDFLFKTRGGGSPLMDVMWVVWDKFPAKQTVFCPIDKPQKGD